MVDVAAIFDEVFGPDDQNQGLTKNRCVRCVGVPEGRKLLKNPDNADTPTEDKKHTSDQGVSETDERCVWNVVENQKVIGKDTPTHRTHRKTNTLSQPVDPDDFEERAGIIEHDGGLPRQEAETLAAQEQGHADADSLHGEVVGHWAAEINRLAKLPAASPDGAEALERAHAFITEGWALQAARLGWDEVDLFGVSSRAPWLRLDRKGVAFGGAIQAITQDAVVYVGGLRRYRAQVNNDGGAVLIWEFPQPTPNHPRKGGNAA